ncbi:hypothetical protein [Billgrantia antri]|uniref:hypothetical protein n=1 Tax=Billgrantia antri TaxID=2846777 RepID=UPI003B2244A1
MPPFDELLLAVMLLLLAAASLFDRHLVRACCWFVTFALAVALSWAWLGLVWLALLELVLGAVLTGAFLFHALGVMPTATQPRGLLTHWHDPVALPWRRVLMRLFPALAVLAMLGLALMEVSSGSGSLRPAGLGLLGMGLWAFALHHHLLRRLLAFNVIGTGIFLILMSLIDSRALAVAHGLVVTGLAVALLGTALGALLIRRLETLEASHHVVYRTNGRPT